MALIAPVALLMMLGMLDLGRAFYQYTLLVNGVREGARVATFDQSATNIKNAVISTSSIGLTASDITITCYAGFSNTTKTCGSVGVGDGVQVSAARDFQPITPRIIAVVGATISLSASSMRSFQ